MIRRRAAKLAQSCLLPLTLAICAPLDAAEPAPLAQTSAIALPGVIGRLDHLALDVAGRRLFIAALGNDSVEVIDLAAGRRLATLASSRPTGVVYLPAANRLGVASSGDGAFRLFDAASLRTLAIVRDLADADNVRLRASAREIYVGFGDGALAVIDADSGARLRSIALGAHPESFQLSAKRGARAFVNLPGLQRIAVVTIADPVEPVELAAWLTHPLRGNYPMALDEDAGRLFVGFREPPRLAVFDVESGARVAEVPICGDTDDVFYDAKRERVYAACGEGFVATLDARRFARPALLAYLPTRAGARTCLFSPEADELYLAVPRRGAREPEIRVYRPASPVPERSAEPRP